MNKVYHVSEVIFGTREKYLELRKKLILLEKLTKVPNNKEVGKVSYRVQVSMGKNSKEGIIIPDLKCRLIQSPHTLEGIIGYSKQYLMDHTINPMTVCESTLVKNNDGNYVFKDRDFADMISISNQEKYKEIADEISKMEIFNNMGFKKIRQDLNEKWYNYILLSTTGIRVSSVLGNNRVGHLEYSPYSDTISADIWRTRFDRHKITTEMIKQLLNFEVEAQALSDYQRSLIESSRLANKRIVIDNCIGRTANFDIEEYPDSIHLTKRKSLHL